MQIHFNVGLLVFNSELPIYNSLQTSQFLHVADSKLLRFKGSYIISYYYTIFKNFYSTSIRPNVNRSEALIDGRLQ